VFTVGLVLDLWGTEKQEAGRALPQFYSLGGEEVAIPKRFREAIQAVTKAVNCIGCFHCQFAGAPKKRDEGRTGVVPAATQVSERPIAGGAGVKLLRSRCAKD
jgi:hypothetical protein